MRSCAVKQPRVVVLTTGGTIAAVGHDRVDVTRYDETDRSVAGEELIASVPELADIADVDVVAVASRPSHDLSTPDLRTLAEAVAAKAADPAVAGVVITHGTNTLEESAYFLHLTHTAAMPVVVTGAMRPASALSADGPVNLLNAVRVAADPSAAGAGVLVTLNEQVHSAVEVTKTASSGVSAFASPKSGPVGRVHPFGHVELWPVYSRGALTAIDELGPLPRVEIVTSHLDADAVMVEAAVAAGAAGIVVAGTGAGYPTRNQEAALENAARAGVTIMVATRTGSGPVARTLPAGWISAGDLQPTKARIALQVALAAGLPPGRLADYVR